MNYRRERGRVILEMGEQVRRLDDYTYEVKSQATPNTKYTLEHTARGWTVPAPTTYNSVKNRPKTSSRSPRIPSSGPAAARIWAIEINRPSLQE